MSIVLVLKVAMHWARPVQQSNQRVIADSAGRVLQGQPAKMLLIN